MAVERLDLDRLIGPARRGSKAVNPKSVFARQSAAIAEYGLTDDPSEAGYILSSGAMLDFSQGQGGARSQDHRNVTFLLLPGEASDESAYGSRTESMNTWMNLTEALRISFNRGRSRGEIYGMIDFPTDPHAVRELLRGAKRSILRALKDCAYVSISKPDQDRVELDPYYESDLANLLREIQDEAEAKLAKTTKP